MGAKKDAGGDVIAPSDFAVFDAGRQLAAVLASLDDVRIEAADVARGFKIRREELELRAKELVKQIRTGEVQTLIHFKGEP